MTRLGSEPQSFAQPGSLQPRSESVGQVAARTIGDWAPIVVTNRAPYQRMRDGRLKRGSGGVITAILGVAEATGATWIACAQTDDERALARSGARLEVVDGAAGFRLQWAMTERSEYLKHYAVVANPLLWFLQHYLWPLAYEPVIDRRLEDAWKKGYVRVNQSIAEAVVAAARESPKPPLVLFQDYHVYLAPALVRAALPDAVLQHFVHIPWPTPQYWTVLPSWIRKPIFEGLLANDIVGFQTDRDVRNFLGGCEELLGLRVDHRERAVLSGGRISWIRAYPVSIDVEALTRLALSDEVISEHQRIDAWRTGKLILRVDRTDPIKNIIRGFSAYEQMLDDHPELRRKVQFWAFLQPSRQDIPLYTEYLGRIRETVDRINARLGDPSWQPIRLELRESITRAVAAYKSFDVLIVNSIYDGMNLVAKEGPYVNERDGVLVLSENAGSSYELSPNALAVNPFDVGATASALYQALTMPVGERRRRLHAMRSTVERADIMVWLQAQLDDIRALAPRTALGTRTEQTG